MLDRGSTCKTKGVVTHNELTRCVTKLILPGEGLFACNPLPSIEGSRRKKMMKRIGVVLSAVFALELLGAFTSVVVQQAEAKKYSFRRHIWPTIRRYCSKCHRPKRVRKGKKRVIKISGGLNMKTWRLAYKNMVGQASKQAKEGFQIVFPGQPAFSYLYYKLVGNHKSPNVGGKGKRMPRKKRRLAAWRINRIVKWIQQGANK